MKSLYKIHDFQITSKRREKDLGIFFTDKFKFNDHIDTIVKKANQQLGIISHIFIQKNAETIIPLYKTFVRPFLEYNSVIWSPYTKSDEEKIEKIQKKMAKMIRVLRPFSYQQKLKKSNFFLCVHGGFNINLKLCLK